jgi:hypothetical protein
VARWRSGGSGQARSVLDKRHDKEVELLMNKEQHRVCAWVGRIAEIAADCVRAKAGFNVRKSVGMGVDMDASGVTGGHWDEHLRAWK